MSDILFVVGAATTILGSFYLVRNTFFVETKTIILKTTSSVSGSQREEAKVRAIVGERLRQKRNAKEGFAIVMIGVVLEVVAHFIGN